MRRGILLIFCLSVFCLSGCGSKENINPDGSSPDEDIIPVVDIVPDDGEDTGDETVSAYKTKDSFAVLNTISKNGNAVYSPAGMNMLLSMLVSGSNGNTQAQIKDFLNMSVLTVEEIYWFTGE